MSEERRAPAVKTGGRGVWEKASAEGESHDGRGVGASIEIVDVVGNAVA